MTDAIQTLEHVRRAGARHRLETEAAHALAELRRIRDLFARRNDPSEAERINARIIALKEVLS